MLNTKLPLPEKVAPRGSSLALLSAACSSAPARAHDGIVTVLAISPLPEDHALLSEIFTHSKWQLCHATNCEEAIYFLRENRVGVVITECDLDDSCWKELYQEAMELAHPRPRFIIASRLADDRLWSEALNLGAYNVLAKPFDPKEVFWVVSHAWLDWKRELEGGRRAAAAAV
jgi:DNA-binding NtrC family response regulator